MSFVLINVFGLEGVVYFIFFLLGFGWSLLFFKGRISIFESIMLAPVLSFCIFVAFISICSMIGMNLTVILGYFYLIFSLGLFLYKNIFDGKNIYWECQKSDILVIILVFSALVAKIIPILDMNVPNLSDAITHSYYAKIIIETGEIPFFYSPGLHIFSAFSTMFGGEDVVKQILYITNFFSAYSGILIYIYVKKVFRDKIAGLVGALLFSLGVGQSLFFYSGGKNALVVGFSTLFAFIIVSSLNRKDPTTEKTILSTILLFSTFIVHYPIAVFTTIYGISIFLIDIKRKRKLDISILLGVVFGLLYFVIHFNQIPLEVGSYFNLSSIFTLPSNIGDTILSYLFSIKESSETRAFQDFDSWYYLVLAVGLTSILCKSIKSRLKEFFWVFLLWVGGCFIACMIIHIFKINFVLIVLETYLLSLFIFLYIFFAFGISAIYNLIKKYTSINLFYIFTILYSGGVILCSNYIYNQYSYFAPLLSVVFEEDLKMFDWIDKNIEDSEGIITNGFYATPTLVGPSDSGGWLTIFTANPTSTPFWEFSHNKTFENLDNYIELQKDLNNCIPLSYFLDNGFRFYFQGGHPIRDVLGEPEILEENGWEVIHSEGGAYLFEIPQTCK